MSSRNTLLTALVLAAVAAPSIHAAPFNTPLQSRNHASDERHAMMNVDNVYAREDATNLLSRDWHERRAPPATTNSEPPVAGGPSPIGPTNGAAAPAGSVASGSAAVGTTVGSTPDESIFPQNFEEELLKNVALMAQNVALDPTQLNNLSVGQQKIVLDQIQTTQNRPSDQFSATEPSAFSTAPPVNTKETPFDGKSSAAPLPLSTVPGSASGEDPTSGPGTGALPTSSAVGAGVVPGPKSSVEAGGPAVVSPGQDTERMPNHKKLARALHMIARDIFNGLEDEEE